MSKRPRSLQRVASAVSAVAAALLLVSSVSLLVTVWSYRSTKKRSGGVLALFAYTLCVTGFCCVAALARYKENRVANQMLVVRASFQCVLLFQSVILTVVLVQVALLPVLYRILRSPGTRIVVCSSVFVGCCFQIAASAIHLHNWRRSRAYTMLPSEQEAGEPGEEDESQGQEEAATSKSRRRVRRKPSFTYGVFQGTRTSFQGQESGGASALSLRAVGGGGRAAF